MFFIKELPLSYLNYQLVDLPQSTFFSGLCCNNYTLIDLTARLMSLKCEIYPIVVPDVGLLSD